MAWINIWATFYPVKIKGSYGNGEKPVASDEYPKYKQNTIHKELSTSHIFDTSYFVQSALACMNVGSKSN